MIDKVIIGDVREVLPTLADESAQMCVTSPPYWRLRDYGTGEWEGGDAGCDHNPRSTRSKGMLDGGIRTVDESTVQRDCHCGAIRIDKQLGLEPTPEEFVANMTAVFRDVRRVLKDDGVLWLNLGDSYAGSPSGFAGTDKAFLGGGSSHRGEKAMGRRTLAGDGLKPKDLVGIPWRVAFALQADGWYLRQDIIWHKPNPMPESVKDRCTKAHEYIFMLSKAPRYYFDADAIKEPLTDTAHAPGNKKLDASRKDRDEMQKVWGANGSRNKRSVWTFKEDAQFLKWVATNHPEIADAYFDESKNKDDIWTVASQAYSEAHFATFPEKLIEPCILAGSRPGDVVLDLFFGSGTTGEVCERFGRRWLGIELNPDYAEMSKRRTAQMGLGL